MNPIPLSSPDGEVMAWACSHCRTSANGWPDDRGHEFAEKCCRCHTCGAPADRPMGRGSHYFNCPTCDYLDRACDTLSNICEAIELNITSEQVWDAWYSKKYEDMR